MTRPIDPHLLYSESAFFLDYIRGERHATDFFQHSEASLFRLAEARQESFNSSRRTQVCDALQDYNRKLAAPDCVLANIELLRDSRALCVMGGQQAGFLGGPLFVLYKIASIIRTAAELTERLSCPVLPIFWLASEDHDFAEINHMRWLDDSGSLRTISFSWDGEGRPIELLPITAQVSDAFGEAVQRIPFVNPSDLALFSPEKDDTYCSWHSRIWSRLFAQHGLIVVEPRVVRPAASPLFARVVEDRARIQLGLEDSAIRLQKLGYRVPLDPDRSGIPFEITDNGLRTLFTGKPDESGSLAHLTLSSDAATRPLLADTLLPTVANIVGPSELAYHAMLRPLYEQWHTPQPLAIPRNGATVISRRGRQLLLDWGIDVSTMLSPSFKPTDSASNAASSNLRHEFSHARQRLEEALTPLRQTLFEIDPGLESRWYQTVDQARHQVDRLEDRTIRADLARRGLSVKHLQTLKPWLLPMDKPQERILSGFSLIANYGVKWIHDMTTRGKFNSFEHQLIVLEERNEQR